MWVLLLIVVVHARLSVRRMRDADHVRCKRAVNAESMRNALHVLQLVLVLLLLVTFAGGSCL